MKKLLTILIVLTCFYSQSQSIIIFDEYGDTLNGKEIIVDTSDVIRNYVTLFDSINGNIPIFIKRYNLKVCYGSWNTINWDISYVTDEDFSITSPVTYSYYILNIQDSFSYNDTAIFDAFHWDYDSLGDAKYRYVFYSDSLADSSFVDIIFKVPGECTTTSTNDDLNSRLNINYNTSTGEITLNQLLNKKHKIDIVDLLGRSIFKSELENSSILVPKNNFKNGIYIIRISDSHKTIITKKILIAN